MIQDGFSAKPEFFTGVVEDIIDPKQMGRVRVRCFGYHTANKTEIPTESLPWALVSMPVTSASMSGIGQSPTGIQPGSWVWGFFRDGPSAQDPFVCGSIPSMTMGGDSTKGFSDPSGVHPINPGSVDNPIEARAEYAESAAFVSRVDLRQEKIEQAVPPKLESVSVPEPDSYYQRKTWDSPDARVRVRPVYPHNSASHSLCGHVREVDDTPTKERLLDFHRSGTFREIYENGDGLTTIVGDNYTVVLGADMVYIKGSATLTIDGDFRQLVKGNYHLEVEGNKTEYVKGSRQSKIGNSDQVEIGQDSATNIAGERKLRIGDNSTTIIDKSQTITIGTDSDVTVGGDYSLTVGGKRQEYSDSMFEALTGGPMMLASKGELNIETIANLNFKTDAAHSTVVGGSSTNTIGGSSTSSISGSSTNTIGGSSTSSISGSNQISSGGALSISASAVSVSSGGNSVTPPWS